MRVVFPYVGLLSLDPDRVGFLMSLNEMLTFLSPLNLVLQYCNYHRS